MTLIAQITDLHIRPLGKKAYGLVDEVMTNSDAQGLGR